MRTDPTDMSIHDLTDDEAKALREVCERIFRGPVEITHPLFVQWAAACGFDDRQRLFLMSSVFLPRALHALLLRAEQKNTTYIGRMEVNGNGNTGIVLGGRPYMNDD